MDLLVEKYLWLEKIKKKSFVNSQKRFQLLLQRDNTRLELSAIPLALLALAREAGVFVDQLLQVGAELVVVDFGRLELGPMVTQFLIGLLGNLIKLYVITLRLWIVQRAHDMTWELTKVKRQKAKKGQKN